MRKEKIEFLKGFLKYDPETGHLTWLKSPYSSGNRSNMKGKKAGGPVTCGKNVVSVRGERFYTEKVIFALMTGGVPKFIRHKNKDLGDDRWGNLGGGDTLSVIDIGLQTNNTSGYRGVFKTRPNSKVPLWQAKIVHKHKIMYLSIHEDKDIAAIVYNVAAVKYHGDRAVLNHVVI